MRLCVNRDADRPGSGVGVVFAVTVGAVEATGGTSRGSIGATW